MKAATYEVCATCRTDDGRLVLLVDVEECGRFTFLTDAVWDPDLEVGIVPPGARLTAFAAGWPNNPLFTGDWYPMADES